MSKISVNGKSYPLTLDKFNITHIDGKPVDKFIDSLSIEDQTWLAKRGMGVVVEDPKYFDDIADRIEMPKDIKNTLDSFKKEQL